MEITVALIVALTLFLYKIAPDFRTLKVGSAYRARNGEVVIIDRQSKVGDFDIFISRHDVRYYANGSRVGDNALRSHFKLIKKVK